MTKSKMANRYSPEVRARAVRMVFEHQCSYETQAGAIWTCVGLDLRRFCSGPVLMLGGPLFEGHR